MPSPSSTKKENKLVAARTYRTECKTIREVWNQQAGKFERTESDDPFGEVSEFNEYVFVDRTSITKAESVSYIDVKSKALRDVLNEVLGDVRSINLRGDKPKINQQVLYSALFDLVEYRDRLQALSSHDLKLQHLSFLIDHIKKRFADADITVQPLLQHGDITFNHLWALFRPNELVITRCPSTGRLDCVKFDLGQNIHTDGALKFRVEGRQFDYDGEQFGEISVRHNISSFQGRKPIRDLEIFPLRYHPDREQVKEQLLCTGRASIELQGIHHRQYEGRAFTFVNGKRVTFQVGGRIMIDAKGFRDANPTYMPPKITTPANDIGWVYFDASGRDNRGLTIADSTHPSALKDHDLLRCSATVRGFSFREKQWLEFAVANIRDITWQADLLDALIVPEDTKAMIVSLAEARTGNLQMAAFDDFMDGKGRGLNILLHGPPGVGKTMTAEAIAEHLCVPLYSVNAGELGTNAAILEQHLMQIFRLSTRWNAILLMDEADIYMEERNTQDLVRNGLVSIFLHNLEYCESIVFLTTNRKQVFDPAILSRMHLTQAYSSMSSKDREIVWKNFLKKAITHCGPADISDRDVVRIAKEELNAREIKNVVAIGHVLASKQQCRMTTSHLEPAMRSRSSFLEDINGMYT